MATCPKCNATISDSADTCEYCGEKIIPGDSLSHVPSRITTWQKVVIGISIIILIAIGLTFRDAEKRENQAAQQTFSSPIEQIVISAAERTGLAPAYGTPIVSLHAQTKKALVYVDFPFGPMAANQASDFGLDVCSQLAKTYVQKGYMPRALAVVVTSGGKNGVQINYGTAVFNGNVGILGWEPASVSR